MRFCTRRGILCVLRFRVAEEFVGKTGSFLGGELAARIDVLTIAEMVDHLVVAVKGRGGVYVSRKASVAVLALLGAGDEEHALEVHAHGVPAFARLTELVKTLLFAIGLGVGGCRLRVLAVGLELGKVGGSGFDEDKIDIVAHFDALGVGHVAVAVAENIVLELWSHAEVVDLNEIVDYLFAGVENVFVVEIAYVYVHVMCGVLSLKG